MTKKNEIMSLARIMCHDLTYLRACKDQLTSNIQTMNSLLVSAVIFGIVVHFLVKFVISKWKLFQVNIVGLNILHPFFDIFYANFVVAFSDYQQRFDIITKFSMDTSPLIKFWFGTTLAIFVNHPDKIQKVLLSSQCLEKWNLFYHLMDRNSGLIAGSVRNKWKEHRKFFNFSFGMNSLESYRSIFENNAKTLCDDLESEIHCGEFDFFAKTKLISLNIISEAFVGLKIIDHPNIHEILKAFDM